MANRTPYRRGTAPLATAFNEQQRLLILNASMRVGEPMAEFIRTATVRRAKRVMNLPETKELILEDHRD